MTDQEFTTVREHIPVFASIPQRLNKRFQIDPEASEDICFHDFQVDISPFGYVRVDSFLGDEVAGQRVRALLKVTIQTPISGRGHGKQYYHCELTPLPEEGSPEFELSFARNAKELDEQLAAGAGVTVLDGRTLTAAVEGGIVLTQL